jgi:phage terminase small subunit
MAELGVPEPPEHLSAESAAWFSKVVEEYPLEEHHLRLLQLACEAWDRGQQARLAAQRSPVMKDRFGQFKPNPAVAIEAAARRDFAMLLRELRLEDDDAQDAI